RRRPLVGGEPRPAPGPRPRAVSRDRGPSDPLPARPSRVAPVGLPDRLRHRTGERGDAERRTSLHARGAYGPDDAWRRCRPSGAAPGRVLARDRRSALPRALPGAGVDGGPGEPRPLAWRAGDRLGPDRRSGP